MKWVSQINFSYLIRNHKDMLIKLFNFKKEINNLYFDSNSIVYDVLCYQKIIKRL